MIQRAPPRRFPLSTVTARCRPHLHTANCVVCKAVSQVPVPLSDAAVRDSLGSTAVQQQQQQQCRTRATRIQLMEDGLLAWLALPDIVRNGRAGDVSEEQARTKQLGIPATLRLPFGEEALWPALRSSVRESNAFLDRLLSVPPAQLGKQGIEKQLLHQQALIELQRAMNSVCGTGVKFFLVCGTALGARREGFFIPHDDDIDIGVFFEDLVELGGQEIQTGASDDECASVAMQRVLSALTCPRDEERHSCFIVFDVCGSVEKGFEARLLHPATGVRLDVNVYYTAREPDVNDGEPFLWSATYYEGAAARRHGMYRYKHTPFERTLERVPFCSRRKAGPSAALPASEDDSFLVPPVSYLEEYFGHDWQTPKQFSYAEGLRGEYKNIIDE